MTRALALALFAVALGGAALAEAGEAPPTIAVFDFELIDRSGVSDPETAEAEVKRLEFVTGYLREKLEASGRYQLVDVAAVEALEDKRLADAAISHYLNECEGCEAKIADALGADLSLLGTVLKINAINLAMKVTIRDAATGEFKESYTVDTMGNTDNTWSHGISYLVRNRLLTERDE
jgi:hypothetical protein